ncbi:cytoplasmic dynein 1 intermediate chain 2-like isoform X5 [Haliotis rufescens]|uniref:cytoplasmic dynein 1 intermediate chain 2-like isoform X5 n=1 Tax=Haliotis rufescens TaxID=6454 RepID=UPI00201F5EC1|nr:cytoplasmic dynein 1 intermediate chain 2-like isoform X5 [Haliotis rufescens]
MADRKAELERKKARLEQMRKERIEKERIKKSQPKSTSLSKDDSIQRQQSEDTKAKPPTDLRTETDKMLRDLGIPPAAEIISPDTTAGKGVPPGAQPSKQGEITQTVAPSSSKRKVNLSMCKVSETNIPPKENVTYSKEVQTVASEPLDKDGLKGGRGPATRGPWDYYDSDSSTCSPKLGSSPRYGSPKFVYPNMEWDDEFTDDEDESEEDEDDEADTDSMDVGADSTPAHRMPHVEMVAPTQQDGEKKEEKIPVREMSEEEKKTIMLSDDFQTFFYKSARVIERAMAEDSDIFMDYSGGDREGNDDDALAGERLKLNRAFYDERWSKHRTITSLDWSTQHPELMVASYNTNEDSPHDPDGVALIWNIKFKKDTPEYVFHCQSPVMSSCFAKFHPNLVVGGTYSGQIVLWDNRVNKRTPVQRTPLSAAAHTHPVYCVNVVGTQNAHNLISVSTDGKMCSWSLDMLSQPQDSMELQHKQSKSVAVTSFCFLSCDVNNFVVGAEDCTVYTACRHGTKAGINEAFEGHQGPVTSIDCHSVPGQIDFSPYFITSSFDWTIKLWSIKDQKFIHSFEDNSDYVYGVQWSPIHPALFASVDGMGRLDLWHLNNETEVPTASVVVDNVALNQLKWHQSGHHIGVGDDLGKISIFDVGEHIANPKSDEWSRFVRTLQELKQHAQEREEDSTLAGMSTPLR